MKFKDVITERNPRCLLYLIASLSYGYGVGVGTKDFWAGLWSFGVWVCVFTIYLLIESMIRKD